MYSTYYTYHFDIGSPEVIPFRFFWNSNNGFLLLGIVSCDDTLLDLSALLTSLWELFKLGHWQRWNELNVLQ